MIYIDKIKIYNFRLLKDTRLDVGKDLSLLIGRNNSGKTSFIMLFDKFLKSEGTGNFTFDDFSLELRDNILNINSGTDIYSLSIKLILEIDYGEAKSLENISEFILDLDSTASKRVKILFEKEINKDKLLEALAEIKDEDPLKLQEKKDRYIKKNLTNFLETKIYSFLDEEDFKEKNRKNLVKKDKKDIDKIINFQVIHAKRKVSSSESSGSEQQALSTLTTSYFNKKSENKMSHEDLDNINTSLLGMDKLLESKYKTFFDDFLNNSKKFLGMDDLKVVSNLEGKEILSHHSKIVYGKVGELLPEHLNGLGYMNILYLLLQVEIKKEYFIENKKDINIFFIEEPEAHTHPQMQSVFINEITKILKEIYDINSINIQTFITTHSSYIVKNCNFEDIRYFSKKDSNVNIKNFYVDLKKLYGEEEKDLFKFLRQYLTINSSELFFAEKIIFIEGITERLLLPYFIKKIDEKNNTNLSSQNISILEVGANAKAFKHFIDFFEIKTLIITDIDTTYPVKKARISYLGCYAKDGTHTSNATLRDFFNSPKFNDSEWKNWFKKLIKGNLKTRNEDLLKISYQLEENGYHGRSFEEAFISKNLDKIKDNKDKLRGLKNIDSLDTESNIDILTEKILSEKSEFAESLLFEALANGVEWEIPEYILNGLLWIEKK